MPVRELNRGATFLFPPTLEELVPADHPVRYVAAFVDGLDRAAWCELGIAPEGAARGALAYHPRVLLAVWLYGFMSGTRSTRELERACRERVAYFWLTGWQRPDHNTLWRFYEAHRAAMRTLLKRTVRTAVELGLVDLAVQAVDGTRVAGSAARERTLDADGLAALLTKTEAAIADLEAQNAGGDDPPPPRLPKRLARLQALREQVRAAQERVAAADGPERTNLTDPDATLQKGRNGGWLVGYNAQAMVAGVVPERPDDPDAPGGLLITAADVTTDRDDHGQLLPLIDQAAETTAAPLEQVLADGGYHSTANLVGCAEHAPPVPVLMPDPQAPRPSQAYHKDRFVYDPASDTFTCPQGQLLTFHGLVARGKGKPPDRRVSGVEAGLRGLPGPRSVHHEHDQGPLDRDQPGRRSAPRAPGGHGHRGGPDRLSPPQDPAGARLRHPQGAARRTPLPAPGPRQRPGRVGPARHRLQPPDPRPARPDPDPPPRGRRRLTTPTLSRRPPTSRHHHRPITRSTASPSQQPRSPSARTLAHRVPTL